LASFAWVLEGYFLCISHLLMRAVCLVHHYTIEASPHTLLENTKMYDVVYPICQETETL
jgi:hypothetical protein